MAKPLANGSRGPSGPAGGDPLFFDWMSDVDRDLRAELHAGLSAPQPWIHPKFFYDRLGSALFAAICELPQYYLRRIEALICERHLPEIAEAVGEGAALIDLGAGNCTKAAGLFERLRPAQYVAIDISASFLRESLAELHRRFPRLPMVGVGLDFSRELRLPAPVNPRRRVFFYPGSSIGNFTPLQAERFLRQLRALADPDGGLLIGVDLLKPAQVLEAAYDDPLGVTAAFNLNLLQNVNRLLGSDFELADWKHVAFLNTAQARIEMHVEARRELRVRWDGGELSRRAGERIHTENSYKYRVDDFESLLARAGFQPECRWTDDAGWFGVFFARPADR